MANPAEPIPLRGWRKIPAIQALSHFNFRILWLGSLLSFTGSWVQRTAQDWLAYGLTNDDPFMLAFVSFCGMAPVSFLGPLMGAYVDMLDRRKLLTLMMIISAIGPLFLGFATYFHFAAYWHLVVVSLVGGFVSTMEMPARQSIVRQSVPVEVLPAAIPTQALTFNFARVAGPAIGGVILAKFGPAYAFWVNGLSFAFLIAAVNMIRADLGPMIKEPQPIRDLVAEGFRYVFREHRLRTIFLLEAATSVFGVFYLGLMAAIAKTKLGLQANGLGNLFTAIGVGAVIGLLLVSTISGRPVKFTIVRVAMSMVAIALCLLAWAPNQAIAMVCLAICGMGTIMQFNTSNTLFQLIAPAHLRGRALAMHMWAVSGVAPAGILIFGWVADRFGINAALASGGGILLAWSVWGWIQTWHMQDPAYDEA